MRPVVGLKRARTLGNRPSEDAWTMVPEPVIISCTGLGAAELFGDPELQPVKGQLTVLLPQPEIDYAVLAGHLYMFARSDGIQLGGTHERGVATPSGAICRTYAVWR
jgi:D-amino-acid oxidase